MHEETQRKILRGAFLLLCLIPTLAVGVTAVVWNTRLPANQLESQLANATGMLVGVKRVNYPRPRQLRVERIRLVDRETLLPKLAIEDAVATRDRLGWRINLSDTSVDSRHLPTLWTSIHEYIVRQPMPTKHPIKYVTCRNLTVRVADRPYLLHNVVWSVTSVSPSHESRLAFSLEPNSTEPQIRVTITRDRSIALPTTTVTLDTKGHALPVPLVTALAGFETKVDAELVGTLPVTIARHRYRANFLGTVRGLPLKRLSPNWIPTPAPLDGTIDVTHADVTVEDAALLQARGRIHGKNVRIWQPLIYDLTHEQACPIFATGSAFPIQPDSDGTVILHEILFDLELDSAGLKVVGVGNVQYPFAAAFDERQRPIMYANTREFPTSRFTNFFRKQELARNRQVARRWLQLEQFLPPTLPLWVR